MAQITHLLPLRKNLSKHFDNYIVYKLNSHIITTKSVIFPKVNRLTLIDSNLHHDTIIKLPNVSRRIAYISVKSVVPKEYIPDFGIIDVNTWRSQFAFSQEIEEEILEKEIVAEKLLNYDFENIIND